jgi:hypothetical protein
MGMRLVAAGLLLAVVSSALAGGEAPVGEIETLIAKLGSTKFAERDKAMRALDQQGAAALKALESASFHDDLEVRLRAAQLMQRIENRLAIARVLASHKMRLVYKDVLVLDAVNDFSAKAGIAINVEGDRLALRERTITLDTGETSFWEALDQFCQAAGLREPPHSGARFNQRIVLIDSKAAALPTCYHGAMRVRAVQLAEGKSGSTKSAFAAKVVGFHVELMPEAKLAWLGVVSLRISKALDDQGQNLVQTEPYVPERWTDPLFGPDPPAVWDGATRLPVSTNVGAWILPVRLQPGKQTARLLKEVHGVVTIELITQQRLATLHKILAAQGKTFVGVDGSTLKVLAVTAAGASCSISVQVSNGPTSAAAGQGLRLGKTKNGVVFIEDPGSAKLADMFALLDAKGQPLPLLRGEPEVVENGKGGLDVQYHLTFETKTQQTPVQLVYSGSKITVAGIPFTLRDVPLIDDPRAYQAGPMVYTR